MKKKKNSLKAVLSGIVGLFLLLTYTGCGANVGQTILSGQAKVVMSTQAARYDLYGTEHERCINESPSFVEYTECMQAARVVARAADAYATALEGAQKAYNVKGARGLKDALPCLAAAAEKLADALKVANVPVPAEVKEIASYVAEIGECK